MVKLWFAILAGTWMIAQPAQAFLTSGRLRLQAAVGGALTGFSQELGTLPGSNSIQEYGYNPTYGATLGVDVTLFKYMSIEAGIGAWTRSFSANSLNVDAGSTSARGFTILSAQIPVIIRFWPVSWLNLGAGAYYARAIGDFSAGSQGATQTLEGFGLIADEGGIVGSIAGHVSLTGFGFFLELRYVHSLNNLATAVIQAIGVRTANYRDWQLTLGLRLGDTPKH
mgnify:CR=1 FL=1